MSDTSCEVTDALTRYRIVPVVRVDAIGQAEPLFDALLQGGLPLAEVTLRTEHAIEAIQLAATQNDFLVGAGTVLNARQCQSAIDAGARFVVSPGLDQGVVETCRRSAIPCFPGVVTATEIQQALGMGVQRVKFFPAEASGGTRVLKALYGPFQQVTFIPTGGINASNAADYLSLPNVLAVGGSWMVKPELYRDGDFTSVTQVTSNALQMLNPGGNSS